MSTARPSETVDAVVFDLDGTLVDSQRDLAAAVNRTLEELGRGRRDEEEILGLVGWGARNLVARALGFEGEEALRGGEAQSEVDRALEVFFGHYDRGLLENTRPYPGVEPTLATLARSYPLAVLTNKPEGFSRRILEGLALDGHLRAVVGGDTLEVKKPEAVTALEVVELLGLGGSSEGGAAPRILLVGDSVVDFETATAATAAGVPHAFAFATWGFTAEDEGREIARRTREAGGWVLERPEDLVWLLDDVEAGRAEPPGAASSP